MHKNREENKNEIESITKLTIKQCVQTHWKSPTKAQASADHKLHTTAAAQPLIPSLFSLLHTQTNLPKIYSTCCPVSDYNRCFPNHNSICISYFFVLWTQPFLLHQLSRIGISSHFPLLTEEGTPKLSASLLNSLSNFHTTNPLSIAAFVPLLCTVSTLCVSNTWGSTGTDTCSSQPPARTAGTKQAACTSFAIDI
jgi:hypothetical protein